jgi:DNA-binding LacI/PurR family transcriptional regulator
MVRISDIAAKCGLSIATVSKALNGSHEIPFVTVEKVKKAADELGYVPNVSARSLKLRRSFTIGVLFVDKTSSGLRHEYFSSILNSVKVEAEKRGYDITFIASDNLGGKKLSFVEHAKSRNIDGVVIASVDFSSPDVYELITSGIPVVTIDYVYNGCTAILSDNDQGVMSLVSYAYVLGHRKISFIHGEDTDVTKKRLAGFSKECQKLGLNIPTDYVKNAIYHDPDTVSKALNDLLTLPNKPTCIICPDDVSALAVLASGFNSGDGKTKDISIAGYDGIALSRMMHPALTTYCQDSEMIGSLAASKLIDRIEHPETFVPEQIVVKGHLQEGGTIKALAAV